jgi:hypothetical protein
MARHGSGPWRERSRAPVFHIVKHAEKNAHSVLRTTFEQRKWACFRYRKVRTRSSFAVQFMEYLLRTSMVAFPSLGSQCREELPHNISQGNAVSSNAHRTGQRTS